MARVEIEAVVATSQPLHAYGGVQIGDQVLEELAEALRSGQLPMLIQHDIRRPTGATILDSQVRQQPDGYKVVWIRFEVDADKWQEFDDERTAAGAPGGFSFSCSEPVTVVEGLPNASAGVIKLAADALHWSDNDLLAAADDLRHVGTVTVERRYEFAHDPAAVVVLQFVLTPFLVTLAGNAVYDGLKRFLRPRRPTIFQFRVERDGSVVDARLETDDTKALRRAIDAFDQLVNPGQLFVWDGQSGQWKTM